MNKLCIVFILLCSIASADNFGTDPCPDDTSGYCMNAKAIEYTNDLRRQKGRSALTSGSMYMFDNAMDHSKVQDRAKDIFHQPIGRGVQVGQGECRVTLSGENVAFYSDGRIKNAAMYCVMDLWKNSRGHYDNMMTSSHMNTVIAIYRSNGRVTCTQTFSGKPLAGSGKCSAALPANRGNVSDENRTSPKRNVQDSNVEETPNINKPQMVDNETSENNEDLMPEETPVTNENPIIEESPTPQESPIPQEPPMMKQMAEETTTTSEEQIEERLPLNSSEEKYILLTVNGKRTKFVKRKFHGSYYICNPKTKRCFGRRTSKKIMRVLMYLAH